MADISAVVIALQLAVAWCYPHKILLGGVFHPEVNDYQDIAFKYAIKQVNMDALTLPHCKIEGLVVNVSSTNSFAAGKKVCELMHRGVVAVLGPHSPASSGIVRSTSEAKHVPNVQANNHALLEPRAPGRFDLNIHPPARTLAKAFVDVIKYLGWKSYALIYETNEGLVRLQELFKSRSTSDETIIVRQMRRERDQRPLLKQIHESSYTHFVLDCSTDKVLDVLRQARELNMMGDYESYLITSLDAHTLDLSEFQYSQTNITSVRIVDPDRTEVRDAVLEWSMGEEMVGRNLNLSPGTLRTEAALMHDAVHLVATALHQMNVKKPNYSHPIRCDSSQTWSEGLALANYMKMMKLKGLTGTVSFDADGQRSDVTLYVVEMYHGGVRQVGTWNTKRGLNHTQAFTEKLYEIQRNVKNKTFIVSTKTGMPYLGWKQPREGRVGNDRFEGFSVDLIEELARQLQFKGYEFHIAEGDVHGTLDHATGKWRNGIMKDIVERKADLGICDFTITFERGQEVDFTVPFLTTGISILYTKPKKPEPQLFSFLKPFSFDVWIYMATVFLGVSVFLYVFARVTPKEWTYAHPCNHEAKALANSFSMTNCLWFSIGSLMAQGCDVLPKLSPSEWRNPHPCKQQTEDLENTFHLKNSLWHNIGSLMQQGSDISPQAVSTRLLAGMWWFFTLIMISSYTANLAAFLTITRMESSIKGVEDLASQSKVKFGPMKGGSTASFFQHSNHSLYQRMWAMMTQAKPDVFAATNQEGVDRVRRAKGHYAFFMESASIEYETERKCDLMQIGGLLDQKGYGIALPIDSPYRTLLNHAILKLAENGVLADLKTKWWREKGGGKCDSGKEEASGADTELTMANVGGVFLVLITGCLVAFFLAVLEFLRNCHKIAVHKKITPWEALVGELVFVMSVSQTTKHLENSQENNTASQSSSYSIK